MNNCTSETENEQNRRDRKLKIQGYLANLDNQIDRQVDRQIDRQILKGFKYKNL